MKASHVSSMPIRCPPSTYTMHSVPAGSMTATLLASIHTVRPRLPEPPPERHSIIIGWSGIYRAPAYALTSLTTDVCAAINV